MRIINEQEFKTSLGITLELYGNANPKYLAWVQNSALKWLLKNKPEFVKDFCTPIYKQTFSLFKTSEAPNGLGVYYFKGVDGQPHRVYLENEFDQKDAQNGILFYFYPTKTLNHWLYAENPIFLEARDFFDDLLLRKPEEDLRKYTLATLPEQIAKWRVELEARLIRERQEALAQAALADEARQDQERAGREADAFIYEALIASAEDVRLQNLKLAWSRMIEGVDYTYLGQVEGMMIYNLLTPRALDYEGTFKGSCIACSAYKNKLGDGRTLLISTRNPQDPSEAIYTAEVVKQAGAFEVIQFEHWGYKFSGKTSTSSNHMIRSKASVEKLLRVSSPQWLFPAGLTGEELTFKITRG